MIDECLGDTDSAVVLDDVQVRASSGEPLTPLELFDAFGFHCSVVCVSRSLFRDGHYAQAIFEAFKRVENEVKGVSGLNNEYGRDLMAKAFNEQELRIRIQLNPMVTTSDRDEQAGFKLIFMGAIQGIRNRKAHDNIVQNDPYRTLEYLGLASLLLKRVDERRNPPALSNTG